MIVRKVEEEEGLETWKKTRLERKSQSLFSRHYQSLVNRLYDADGRAFE